VTGVQPLVTGKPDPAMHAECVRRTGAVRPLVVGDRLDTDIEGARAAGAASLLVLTGVTDPRTLLAARPDHRPDLLSADVRGLLTAHPPVTGEAPVWRCGVWTARRAEGDDVLVLEAATDHDDDGDGLDGLRALCVAHWSRHPEDGVPARVVGGDDRGTGQLLRWQLAD
jgi:glycerol 3-phosphatase-2